MQDERARVLESRRAAAAAVSADLSSASCTVKRICSAPFNRRSSPLIESTRVAADTVSGPLPRVCRNAGSNQRQSSRGRYNAQRPRTGDCVRGCSASRLVRVRASRCSLSLSLSLSLSGVMGWQFLHTRGPDVAGRMTRANSTDMTQSQ